MFSRLKISFTLLSILFVVVASAHQNHHHSSGDKEKKSDGLDSKKIYEQINLEYEKNVKPIFQEKCMDCHSSQTRYPSYYNWPIAKSLIDGDIAESKKHIDMTNGFPFAGHGTPLEDLNAIKKEIQEGEMPPLRYRLMHWKSALTEEEKNKIRNWIDESSKALTAVAK